MNQTNTYQPQFFDSFEDSEFVALRNSRADLEIIDAMPEAIEDLFKIEFPFVAGGSPEYRETFQQYQKNREILTKWVYYPWRNVVVHLPEAADYQKLRTARNKFLITPEEQAAFYGASIGIAGLSVGSSAVNSLVLSGGAGDLRLADFDTLAITNLNRLLASAADLTRPKAIISARRVYEMNPYQKITLFAEGLDQEAMRQFFQNPTKLDLFVEEVDDIKLKIESRFLARELGIPVLMATDNGDNAMIDIERFDLEPDRPLFHGLVDESLLKTIPEKPSMADRIRLASTIVGSNITPRTQHSLTMVGSKLPSWPQLGNAATLSGVVVSYVARRILCGQPMPSGRYHINLDELLDPQYHDDNSRKDREQGTRDFEESLSLLFGVKL